MLDGAGVSRSLASNVYAVAAHLGVSRADISLASQQGQVNLTAFLGRDLVLRVPRKPAVEDRLAKEAAVIPLVQAAGVPTARLVSFDASHRVAEVSYIVLERLHGSTLAECGYEPGARSRAHASLGEILVVLHELRRKDVGPISGVPEPPTFAPEQLVARLSEAGELGSTQGQWLVDWFRLLEAQLDPGSEPSLLHGDVIPSNLIVDRDGQVTAIIDWGSARWGDPVRDLADLPTRALPSMVSGYRSAGRARSPAPAPWSEGASLEAGVLWYQLFWALAKLLGETSTSEQRNWSAPRQARLFEILRFLSDAPPSPWPDLLLRDPAYGST